jgi:hypothetical protein
MGNIYEKVMSKIPLSLANIEGLFELKINGDCSGIYFLLKNSKVVYVGQSLSIASRVINHQHEKQKDFDQIFYLKASPNDLLKLEHFYINYFKPIYNNSEVIKKELPEKWAFFKKRENLYCYTKGSYYKWKCDFTFNHKRYRMILGDSKGEAENNLAELRIKLRKEKIINL